MIKVGHYRCSGVPLALFVAVFISISVAAAGSAVAASFGPIELPNPTPTADDSCGVSIASGDFNGDATDDVVFGCFRDDAAATDAGSVVVQIKRTDARAIKKFGEFKTAVELQDPSPGTDDKCGVSVATGDINGDGSDDIVTGCIGHSASTSYEGNAIVFLTNGLKSGFDAGIELANPSAAIYENCGASVAIDDVNGDGNADVLMGCSTDKTVATSAGSVVIFTRNSANNGFNTPTELTNPKAGSFSYCGAGADLGDVNGDGNADVVMGCGGDDTGASAAGNVVVFTRNAANTGFDSAVQLDNPTPAANDACGVSIAVGDVNGDGNADISSSCRGAGGPAVFTRNAANTGFDTGIELINPAPTDDSCDWVAIGDANNDGNGDVLLGCANYGGDAGDAVLFKRDSTNTGFDSGVLKSDPTPAADNLCGVSVAFGDIDKNGSANAMIGCYQDDTGASNAGNVVVFRR